MEKKQLILASKSPRRIEILSKYIEGLESVNPEVDERIDFHLKPKETAMAIALKKALQIANNKAYQDCIVLASDTIVYLDRLMGKPKDRQDAYNMLCELNGREHSVITGFAIIHRLMNRCVIDFDQTYVQFEQLTQQQIEAYLDTREFKDKAGAYGIQGYGELLVKSIVGSYANVMGLPIGMVNKYLRTVFEYNLLD